MTMITVRGHAKINLALDVCSRRTDGYHEVDMLMCSLDLHDTITLRPTDGDITVQVEGTALPTGRENIAYRAAALFRDRFATGGVKMNIRKRIPVAAGLAGGSADAAAVLAGMAALYEPTMPQRTWAVLAPELGADVAFAIRRGTARATGIGTTLKDLPHIGGLPVLLVKPPVGVSTAETYRQFDAGFPDVRPDIETMMEKLKTGELNGLSRYAANVLEPVTMAHHPRIQEIKNVLQSSNPVLCLMSGSGPTVFALYGDQATAEKMYVAAGKLWKDCEVLLTSTETSEHLNERR
ncbi:MAG: 4-(cytidine 5'-diphospho)-2-C-methyl-D-erythritol kinase [Eubacteriales bacterium]|nr:4-(cytidine 5'-diphospho)-2-C-methyl-D-erythritol kinase [Eubacteriales bacterium]